MPTLDKPLLLNSLLRLKLSIEVFHHFSDIRKMIDIGKGAQREIEDVALTREGTNQSFSKESASQPIEKNG